jgi:asparagine synthase (glutamine-hydrolysing)
MCGIVGFLSPVNHDEQSQCALLDRMSQQIIHRGPDSSGKWVDPHMGVALAHRRLAIVDVSPAGHQPMVSASGRFVLVFNGEIYNHLELRERLGGVRWRGHSDTETLLAGFEAWGVRQTLTESVGMFALAVWDSREQALILARDRIGEKPLYYGWQGGELLFGSELKALRAHPAFDAGIHRGALALFMQYGYIPAPHSIYDGIYKLPPGCLLEVRSGVAATATPETYWSFPQLISTSLAKPFEGGETAAIDALDAQLRRTIGRQMVADVPLGAFLSGGIDSSTVVALMQAQSSRPVRTFTIGFSAQGYDEAHHGAAIARHLGTDHTELYVSPDMAMPVIERLPHIYDEPFADSSQIPTYLVSQLTREHVTVGISGDGGDELFGGYNRHVTLPAIWHLMRHLPLVSRRLLGRTLMSMSPLTWSRIGEALRPVLPKQARFAHWGDKVQKLSDMLVAPDAMGMYCDVISQWKTPHDVVLGASDLPTIMTRPQAWPEITDFAHLMMAMDTLSYLPGDILTKVDRASMSVSLETRLPFLDHELMAFVWRLPFDMKIRAGQGKWALRQVLERYVPRSLIDRPKAGFAIPIDEWLRGSMKDWAEALLDEARLRREGFFDPVPVRTKWAEHLSGIRNWQHQLWNVLMFQSWLEAQCA